MANVKSVIQSHNKKILTKDLKIREKSEKTCNCQNKKKAECPLSGNCVVENVIYEATVTTPHAEKKYVGSTGGFFKKRWYKHISDFNNKKQRLSTELSKYIWKLKDDKTDFKIKWKILRKIRQKGETIKKVCTTCNLEKLEIALADKRKCLNKRSELVGKCIHYQRLYF